MVKRKRIPSVPGSEEKNVYSNGMTLVESDCVDCQEADCAIVTVEESAQDDITSISVTSPGSIVSPGCLNIRQSKAPCLSGSTFAAEQAPNTLTNASKDGILDELKKSVPNNTGPILRSSARVLKRPSRDTSPTVTSKPTKKNGTVSSKPGTSTEQGKVRRAWEQWSIEDKNTFFEALCEFGKDFENIQNYIVQKNRKKGHPPQAYKNKDQVRHFYYRTWHKISKHLDISDDIKKQAQELYGLINFGELRKKIGGRLDEKNGQKLNELVHKGATTIRCKGKNLRIKTPICRALKKLNDVEDPKDYENSKLPPRICMELRPRCNRSWSHVQSIAQNPRVRLNVSLQRCLSSIINFLQQRWRIPALKQKGEFHNLGLESEELERLEKEVDESRPVLRVMPRKCDKISLVSVSASTEISSASVSLQNYRRKVQCSGNFSECTVKKGMKGKGKGADEAKKAANEEKHGSPDAKGSHEHNAEATSQQLPGENVSDCLDRCEARKNVSEDLKMSANYEESNSVPAHELTLRHLLALENAANPPPLADNVFFPRAPNFLCDPHNVTPVAADEMKDSHEIDKTCDKKDAMDDSPADAAELEDLAKVEVEDRMQKIKRGWILKECGTVTVGEVYLMLGHPGRLILEYDWESVASDAPMDSPPPLSPPKSAVQQLTAILGKLIHTASSTFSELSRAKQDRQGSQILQICKCGHHCCSAASNSKSLPLRSPSGIRNAKSFKVALAKPAVATEAGTVSDMVTVPGSTNTGTINVLSTDVFRKPNSTTLPTLATTSKASTSTSQAEKQVPCDKTLKEQLDKYTQHRKAKGRMKKAVFVQRELPLLPKAGPTHSMMTLRIVPNASQLAGSFMPVLQTSPLAPISASALRQGSTMAKVVSLSTASALTSNVTTLMTSQLGGLTTTGPIMTTTSGLSLPKIALAAPIRVAGTPSLAASIPTHPANGANCTILLNSGNSASVLHPTAAVANLTTLAPTPTASTSVLTVTPTMADILVSTSSTSKASGELTHLTYSLSKQPGLSMRVTTPMAASPLPKQASNLESGLSANLSVSPPNISSILGISLPGQDGGDNVNLVSDVSNDKLLDMTLGNSNSGFSGFIGLTAASKLGNDDEGGNSLSIPILSSDVRMGVRPSTPINSPTNSMFKISSPCLDSHWFNGDVSDFSLSNFLSHLESPAKVSAPVASTTIGQTENTSDMDPNFHCVMNENCIDYISKFEDFAAQMTTGDSQSAKKLV